MAFEGRELAKARRYADARIAFRTVLEREPWNREALLGLAELALRAARYDDGLAYANRALQLDSYDARANFVAGNLYRATGRIADARDAFGWSARSTAYRSASYVQLAEIMLAGNLGTPDTPGIPPEPAWSEVKRYAELALDFDRQSIPARQLLAIRGRRLGDSQATQHAKDALLETDPLHHFVLAEEYLSEPSPAAADRLLGALRSEYADQSLLELAVGYAVRGLEADAAAILELADQHHGGPVVRAWHAFLAQSPAMLRDPGDVAFAFPFRPETLPVLRWAAEQSEAWLWTYLLGLNLWGLDRHEEAAQQLASLGNVPDYGPAYAARAKLLHEVENRDPASDLARAIELEPENRLLHIAMIRHAQEAAEWPRSVEASTRARERFPGDFNVALLHARGLIATDRHREAAQIMDRVRVLPSENARESHRLYELAHVAAAADELSSGNITAARPHIEAALLWPESLGQGRPYAPDERLSRYVLGVAETTAENADDARRAFEAVLASTSIVLPPDTPVADRNPDRADLLAVLALRGLGQTDHLAVIAAEPAADRSPAYRAVAALAHALTLPDVTPAAAAAQILRDYPEIFSGPEGRVIGKILALGGPPEQRPEQP